MIYSDETSGWDKILGEKKKKDEKDKNATKKMIQQKGSVI